MSLFTRGKSPADVCHRRLATMGYTGSERTVRRAVAAAKRAYLTISPLARNALKAIRKLCYEIRNRAIAGHLDQFIQGGTSGGSAQSERNVGRSRPRGSGGIGDSPSSDDQRRSYWSGIVPQPQIAIGVGGNGQNIAAGPR